MENKINSLATVHVKAELDGVIVHPYCVIEEGVRISKGTELFPGAIIKKGSIIGENNTIGEHTVIGGSPGIVGFDVSIPTGVKIGNNNEFSESVTINRASKEGGITEIGNNCTFMHGSHMGHDSRVGNEVIMVNTSVLGGHVEVGDYSIISASALIHQFVKIGQYVMVSGGVGVAQCIPDFLIVVGYRAYYGGINLVGMRRRGFSTNEIKEIKKFYYSIYGIKGLPTEIIRNIQKDSLTDIQKKAYTSCFMGIENKCGLLSLKKSR